MEQQTGSKLGKEYVKAVDCHPAYLTYMQSTSCEMLGWMKHKLESGLQGKILIIQQVAQNIHHVVLAEADLREDRLKLLILA